MIERLKNCPNCAGYLDDSGRCNFCGSKLYDFCDIDVISPTKNYLRIKTNKGIITAPVMAETVNLTFSSRADEYPTIEACFYIIGAATIEEVDKNDSK